MKKTTSQNFSKRLAQYGALTAAIAGVGTVNGQVNYTDLGLTEVDNTSYNLDVDNDGTPEFTFTQASYNLFAIPTGINAALLGSSSSSYMYPFALSSGATISNSQSIWIPNNGYNQSLNFSNCLYGNWCNPTTDKYLGLRFEIGGETHYGWARLSVYNIPGVGDYPNTGWAITGYAYEETANTSILAGDTGTLGLNDNAFNTVKIVALNKSIALYNLPESTNYKLYSITGQSILEGKTTQNSYVIEANAIASGVYVLEVKDNASNAILKKKVVL